MTVSKIGDYDVHPAADLLPLMQGEEFRQFVESIRLQGQKEPIRLHEGKVLDGRNRLRACLELGLQPKAEAWQGEDPWEHVWALNAQRRHLSQGQLAAIRLEFDRAIAEHQARIAELANRARAEAARRRKEVSVQQAAYLRQAGTAKPKSANPRPSSSRSGHQSFTSAWSRVRCR